MKPERFEWVSVVGALFWLGVVLYAIVTGQWSGGQ